MIVLYALLKTKLSNKLFVSNTDSQYYGMTEFFSLVFFQCHDMTICFAKENIASVKFFFFPSPSVDTL